MNGYEFIGANLIKKNEKSQLYSLFFQNFAYLCGDIQVLTL